MQTTAVDTDIFEPLVIEGEPTGEVHWIEAGVSGIWRVLPGQLPEVTPYVFHRTETLQVLEGSVEIVTAEGDSLTVRVGEVATVPRGVTSTWRIEMPFRKLFVHS